MGSVRATPCSMGLLSSFPLLALLPCVTFITLFATSAADAAPARPHYVATVPPLAAILREIAGTRADITALLPVGVSEHTYQPRPSDARAAESANCLFYVSQAMDGWAAGLSTKKKVDVFALVPREFLLPDLEGPEERAEHASGNHHASAGDPHFWLDPLCVKAIVPALAASLAESDPEGRAEYEANAQHFLTQLDDLHRELTATLEPVRGRAVILFHPSFRYFLKRYGLGLAGVIELFPGKEPSPRYLQTLIAQVKSQGAKAVFTEPQLPPRPAEVVAEAAGVRLGVLDPVGGQKDRAAYGDLLRYNARVLSEALK
ncbi:MAG: zinc ABC transporter substrate-binding protein [Candidatus Hydrogenedentes bacterium]|nr:zinc ABC transporter substrate-binding protein [Candidatus Hydrogenedentota bacterium]